jgi:hypothetical protein
MAHEWYFYEVMWRLWARGMPYPLPWWVQTTLAHWSEDFDTGLFDSREAALASNALYRYWSMVGVKDHHQETLVGQAGEVEPVYDAYCLGFFLFDPQERRLHLPQQVASGAPAPQLEQHLEDGYLPTVVTTYRSPVGVRVVQRVLSTTLGDRQRSITLVRLRAHADAPMTRPLWLCASLVPAGPTGFQRRDRAGRYREDRRITFLRFLPAEQRVEVNTAWGPVFDTAPAEHGLYGAPAGAAVDDYVAGTPFHDLERSGTLNRMEQATDATAGLCTAAFAWPFQLDGPDDVAAVDIKLPVDDYRGDDHAVIRAADADEADARNRGFWRDKLDGSGLQAALPPRVAHLWDLYRTCRATLLILADDGAIHPGPTIYDSFWVRDSSIEGIACALAGDSSLAQRQFGDHYPSVFHLGPERLGPVALHGFFGGEAERNAREWDANGEALWAIGRLDRVLGAAAAFGARMWAPYVVEGARWLRDNRDGFGLLHSGWSAEHLGRQDAPHYWDDLWGLAGLSEAVRLSERIGAPERDELGRAFDDLQTATADSIRWSLERQRSHGLSEAFIPTGPADALSSDSTMIGTVAYFHPCRLYMGRRLGEDIDAAARGTLDVIWARFVHGGFRHDAAWRAYGPYLTLQLAHAFLLVGDVGRMDSCLAWSVAAARAGVRRDGAAGERWPVVQGAWNEQHCYPVASDFAEVPRSWWYMGDIPHGWAAAELMLLLRDILFFEADEDGSRHIYLFPGVMPHWVADGEGVEVRDAPTIFGTPVGFRLRHDAGGRRVELRVLQPPPPDVRFVYPCRFGDVAAAEADGVALPVAGRDVALPAGMRQAVVTYR